MLFRNPLFLVLYPIGLWLVVTFLISALSGWMELGRSYRAQEPFQGEIWRFQDCYMRLLTRYGRIVNVGAGPEGLYLALFGPFRFAHPPLFIPWQDISVKPAKVMWMRVYQFEFRQAPSVHLRLRETLGKKVEAAAGSSWPGNRSAVGAAF